MFFSYFYLVVRFALDLLDEFENELIPYLVGTRNRINMVLKLHKEKNITYKQRNKIKDHAGLECVMVIHGLVMIVIQNKI